jgi:hypothetical protein
MTRVSSAGVEGKAHSRVHPLRRNSFALMSRTSGARGAQREMSSRGCFALPAELDMRRRSELEGPSDARLGLRAPSTIRTADSRARMSAGEGGGAATSCGARP